MNSLQFIWDPDKEKSNIEKHDGISFAEAQTVFYDSKARLIFDPLHSKDEDRFVILGFSQNLNILVVCHCYKENDSIIRIISARRANKKEKGEYERYRNS